jgi:serine phosphatase RsbU (regulator of sigma subunit)
VLDDIDIEDHSITLDPGACLIMYTDGVTEAFSTQDEAYGMERLCKKVKDSKASSMQVLLEVIENSVQQFSDPLPLADDMTMLAIRRTK